MVSALRLVFNATALLFLLALTAVLGLAALHGRALPWEQLALGRRLCEAASIPAHGDLLFTAPASAPFDAGSWAWDWAAFRAWGLYGQGALRFSDGLLWLCSIWALAAAAFRRGARPFSTAIFCAWALLTALGDLEPGPGLAGFAAFCAALWVMEGDFWPAFFGRWIWLGPLAVVAVNLSPAAWLLAPLVLAHLAFGAGAEGAPNHPKLAKTLFFALLLVCLCLHPQGALSLGRVGSLLGFWPLNPAVFGPRQGALLLLVLAWLLLVGSSWTQAGRTHLGRDWGLLLVFTAAALACVRALPYALVLCAPLCAARFDALTDALPAPLKALRWSAKLLVLAALVAWTALGGGPQSLSAAQPGPRAEALPAQTVAFYGQQMLEADILCPRGWTPWLAWKLAPHARFALDPRGLAEPARAAALQAALSGSRDALSVLARQGVNLCWIPRGSPLALMLGDSQDWQPISFDDASVVYVPVTAANRALIQVWAPRGLRPGDPGQPFDSTRLVETEADLEADLARDPDMGVLYLYMARLWLARGRAAKARETLEGGIRADPAFAPDYAALASLRAGLGDFGDRQAARALYRLALNLDPRPEWAHALAALGSD